MYICNIKTQLHKNHQGIILCMLQKVSGDKTYPRLYPSPHAASLIITSGQGLFFSWQLQKSCCDTLALTTWQSKMKDGKVKHEREQISLTGYPEDEHQQTEGQSIICKLILVDICKVCLNIYAPCHIHQLGNEQFKYMFT